MLRHLKRRQRGMTLVELTAVLAILGIIIGLAVPRYLGVRKKAYKDEGTHLLEEIKVLEWGYYLQNSAFTTTLTSTGFVMPGGSHWAPPALSASSGNGNCNNGNGSGSGGGSGNGNGNGNGNGGGNGQGNQNGQGQNGQGGNCNGNGNGSQTSVVITISGQVVPLGGMDQMSVILYSDGSAGAGSTF